jgi:glycosyltransferase involved in cell wall biosynthesis
MNQAYPKISIVTPSYNQGQYIEETILSVIGQNYPNLEYIIIDGGSTDNSVEIIKKYEKHLAYWVSEKDGGIYDAMNKGIDKATGEWIYFLGTDDVLCEGVLNELFGDGKYKEVDFLYGDAFFKNQKRTYDGTFNHLKLINANICHQAIFFRKETFSKIGKFELKYKIYADWYFNMCCFANNEIKKCYVPLIISEYNELGSSAKVFDTDFMIDKASIVITLLKKHISRKLFYCQLGDAIFTIMRYKSFIIGWREVILAIIYTRKINYYLKNAFYWSRQRLLNKI